MSTSGWVLVETLQTNRLTVIEKDRKPSGRTSFAGILREVKDIGGNRPSKQAAAWIDDRITEMRQDLVPLDKPVTLDNGRVVRVIGRPVVGPGDALHAVHLWVGVGADTAPTDKPSAAIGFTWNSDRRLVDLTETAAGAFGRPEWSTAGRGLTAPEALRFVRVSDGLSLIRTILTREPGKSWVGLATVFTPLGQSAAQLVVGSDESPDGRAVWRGVLHDVSATTTPPAQSLESSALAALRHVSQSHIVLLDIGKMRLIDWITDPIPQIQWKGMVDNRDTPHPDDVQRIFDTAGQVFGGHTPRGEVKGIRLRRFGGGWTVVDASGGVLPTAGEGPLLALVQFDVTGTSNEPDPVPPTDNGHPGLE